MAKTKILIIHNKYRNLGGEDLAVENETSFLKEYFNVEVLYFSNNIFIATQILNFFFNKNFFAERKIFNKIEEFNPEIVYFHNTWFNIWNNVFLKLSEIADFLITFP